MFEKRKKGNAGAITQIISLLIVFAIITAIIVSLPSFKKSSGKIREESIENIIKKYVIQCYASEGSYPPSLDYLAQNYGLIIDDKHYVYYYDAFAANFMPEIEVYSRREKKAVPPK